MAHRFRALAGTLALLVGGGFAALGCSNNTAAPPGTTGPNGSVATEATIKGLDALALGIDLARRTYPNAEARHAICIGGKLERDPSLLEAARKPLDQLEVNARKQVVRLLADCIGIDGLVAVYEAKHPMDPKRRDCVFQHLANRALGDSVAIVADDPDPAAKFANEIDKSCKDQTTTTPPTGTAPKS